MARFYMLGLYVAYSSVALLGDAIGFWPALLLAPLVLGLLGARWSSLLLLRRVYRCARVAAAAGHLCPGAGDHGRGAVAGARRTVRPARAGAGRRGGTSWAIFRPMTCCSSPSARWCWLLTLLLTRTRWGTLVRAATQDREMVGALGVNQAWLFTGVFALGAALAGLGGAAAAARARQPGTGLLTIGAAFVVVVVGGMGSLARRLCRRAADRRAKAVHLAGRGADRRGDRLPKLTPGGVLVMAPCSSGAPGVDGRLQAAARRGSRRGALAGAARWPAPAGPSQLLAIGAAAAILGPGATPVLLADIFIAAVCRQPVRHRGPAGCIVWPRGPFGLGAYGAALLTRASGPAMGAGVAAAPWWRRGGALLYGWFCVRLSGVSLTMLTLAFAQITWAIAFQWDGLTGGSNGLTGVWPPDWAPGHGLLLAGAGFCAAGLYLLRRRCSRPGWRAARRARLGHAPRPLASTCAACNGGFVVAGLLAGWRARCSPFSRRRGARGAVGQASRSTAWSWCCWRHGSWLAAGGPRAAFTWLHRQRGPRHRLLRAAGGIMLALVLLFPQGISGFAQYWQALIAPKKE